jgi:nitronate monooxygenase
VSDRAGCPPRYAARTLLNRFTDTWAGRGAALESDQGALGRATADRGDREYLPMWAAEGVDLIAELDSASVLVARIADHAQRTITMTGNTVQASRVRHRHER